MFDITPVTSNKDTVCGPACLKMLLAYYGVNVELDTLIKECGVSVNGCSAKDMLRVGKAHGLKDMAAFQIPAHSVLQNDRPAIIWWRFNHFVVLCGVNEKGEPVICNPGRGLYPIDVGTFSNLYSGIALTNGRPSDLIPEDYFGENEKEPDYFEH